MSIWYWILFVVLVVSLSTTMYNLIKLSETLGTLADKLTELEQFYNKKGQ